MIDRAAKTFHKLLTGNLQPNATQQFNEITQLITEKIPEHFADEEAVFPSLLVENPSPQVVKVIAELRTEHIQLLDEIQQVGSKLHHCSVTQCPSPLWLAMLDIFKALEKHAAKEDQLFKLFP